MKILIINTSERSGAGRAAYRLHKGLQKIGVSSQMLVQNKSSDDHTVIDNQTRFKNIIPSLRLRVDGWPVKRYKNQTSTSFSPAWIPFGGVVKKIRAIDPDIVHLHWICGGMIRIEELARIKKPIIWSLHDMWAFTGGCHYDEGCGNYKYYCGQCPVLVSKNKQDLSSHIFKRKVKIFEDLNMTIVGLSKWLSECAQKSTLLKNKRVVNLPNSIDVDVFKPLDRNTARNILGLPVDKNLILFGSAKGTSEPRKGYKELSEALHHVKSPLVELAIFGTNKPRDEIDLGFPVHYLGKFYDDISLGVVYNAANVMIVPSLQENLSNSIMESLSCSIPVVGFDIGGNRDMIDHKRNGYLAKPYNVKDLAFGIDWVLKNSNSIELSMNARTKVLENFEMCIVAQKYKLLYEGILN